MRALCSVVLFALSALSFVACGLDSSGLADGTVQAGGGGAGAAFDAGSVSADASALPTDSGVSTGGDGGGAADGAGGPPPPPAPGGDAGAPPGCNGPAACAQAVPAGWTLALLGGGDAACPSGFASHAVVRDPSAGPGACACSCAISGTPTCENGALDTFFSNDGSCSQTGATFNVSGGTCTGVGGLGGATLDNHFAAKGPAAQVACTSSTAKDASKVTTAPSTLCDATVACEEAVCTKPAPSGFSACIYTNGDVPCPGAPWTSKTVVGDAPVLSCSSCGCSASATCTAQSVRFYSDGVCLQPLVSLTADGACQSTASGGRVGSLSYTATVTNAACATSGSSAATVALSAARTVCCR